MQSSATISAHRNLMQRDELRIALDFALMEYQSRVSLTSKEDMNGAVAGHFRMLGAQEFVQTLRSLKRRSLALPGAGGGLGSTGWAMLPALVTWISVVGAGGGDGGGVSMISMGGILKRYASGYPGL
jgi:hypothetical protein